MHRLPPEPVGGTERHVLALAGAQARRHAVAIFTRVRGAAPESCGEIRVFSFEQPEGAGTSFLERTDFPPAEDAFRDAAKAFRPEVVHVHHLSGLSAGILGIAADSGARVVFTIHDHALACPRGQRIRLDLDPCPVLDRDRCVRCVRPAWIEAARSPDRLRAIFGALRPGEGRRLFEVRDAHLHRNLDRVGAFVAPSRSAAELFLEFHPGARPRLSVVPHGFEPAGTPPAPAARAPGEPFRAAYFGALLPSKGVFVLAEAAARLRDEPFRIALHGHGDPRVVEDLLAKSGGAVEIGGPYRVGQLGELMARAHAVLIPSLWPETFSIVAREAWAHGRPVLASSAGALVEAAGEDGRRLGLVPPGDVAAWTAAIRRLASDAAWYAGLSGPHAPEPFTAMLSAIEACYISPA